MKLKAAKRPSCRQSKASKWGLCQDCRAEQNAPGNKKGGLNRRAEQAEAARKNQIKLQIKRSEANLKIFFNELKKILQKPDEDVILPELATSKVTQAKAAENDKHLVSFMYTCLLAAKGPGKMLDPNAHKKPKKHDVSVN